MFVDLIFGVFLTSLAFTGFISSTGGGLPLSFSVASKAASILSAPDAIEQEPDHINVTKKALIVIDTTGDLFADDQNHENDNTSNVLLHCEEPEVL